MKQSLLFVFGIAAGVACTLGLIFVLIQFELPWIVSRMAPATTAVSPNHPAPASIAAAGASADRSPSPPVPSPAPPAVLSFTPGVPLCVLDLLPPDYAALQQLSPSDRQTIATLLQQQTTERTGSLANDPTPAPVDPGLFNSLSTAGRVVLPALIAERRCAEALPKQMTPPATTQARPASTDPLKAVGDSIFARFPALANLTASERQTIATIVSPQPAAVQHRDTTPFDPSMPKSLSPEAMLSLPILVRFQGAIVAVTRHLADQMTPARDLAGRPPPLGAMTLEQSFQYRMELATNHFQAPIPPANLPPILHHREDDLTEDDWLARLIVQDIAAQVIMGLHLKQPIDHLGVHVDVNEISPDSGHIMVSFIQWIDDPQMPNQKLSQALPIDFAWDAAGYSVLAEYLIGSRPLSAATPDPEAPHLLGDLLDLTGPRLAREDVRLSALLQKNPLDASAQGEAALLLTAMAWRENAGDFSDSRRLLCKAAAHLALALAVDNLRKQAPDWNAQVAGLALSVLAGREA